MNDRNCDTAIFQITDAFNITDRGCVVAGELKHGIFRMGDKVIISRSGATILYTEIIGIEMFTHNTHSPSLLLRGITKNDVKKNDCVIGIADVG